MSKIHMILNHTKSSSAFVLLLAVALVGCTTARTPVPLVYEYPRITKQKANLAEGVIVVTDQRTDKSIDKSISSSLSDAIKDVLNRELAAIMRIRGSVSGNADENAFPVQIQVDLLKTSAEVPSHVRNSETALGVTGVAAGLVTGGVALLPLAQYQLSNHTSVVGEVQMRVRLHNVQSGANWEETWIGVTTVKVPIVDKDLPQTNSKAVGGALKDAMSHLPDALAHVGVETQ